MSVCEKSTNCLLFSCKGEFFKLVDYIPRYFTPDDELLEVSEYILAQNWEGRSPELGIYGLSCVVYKGGYPTHIPNRQLKRCKTLSIFKNPYEHCTTKCLIFHIVILLSGDIATNPGPIKYPCGSCAKPVRSNQHGLQCDDCNIWSHHTCLSISKDEYLRLSDSDESWYCRKCISTTKLYFFQF